MNSSSLIYCLIDSNYHFKNFLIEENNSFSEEELNYLKNTLTENLIQNLVLAHQPESIKIFILLNGQINYPKEELLNYFSNKVNIQYFTSKESFLENLKGFSKFFLIYNDIMGLSPKDIKDSLNLISSEDSSLVISKSEINEICYIAFNKLDTNLIELISESELNYDSFLSRVNTEDFFIHTVYGHFRVNSFSNFKLLYNRLSQKDSLEYCSQEMHEKFTNLFIEYRDYIK